MKAIYSLLVTAAVALTSCKKEEILTLDAGAINVTNAVIGGATITLMVNQSVVSSSNTVTLNNFAWMPIRNSEARLMLGVPAVAATATTAATPAVIYYDQPFNKTSTINQSLFLTGASPASVESVLINETFPFAYSDSTCGVRFINLAQGNIPMSVNIKGSPAGSEAANIPYKAYSDFKMYPAKSANASYIFEFRKTDGTLITSYTLVTPFFHNVTLALRGTIGGTTGIILTNHY